MSKRVIALVAGAVAVLLAIAGCSSRPTQAPSAGVPTATAQPDTAGQAPAGDPGTVDSAVGPTSPRGARPWKVGERIQTWGPPKSAGIGQYVTITAIRPVTSCAGQAIGPSGELIPAKPTNGRFLAVDMTIEDTPAYDTSQGGYYVGTAQQYDYVTSSGRAVDDVDTTVAFYCTGKESPFQQLKPGRTYTGTVDIDVPVDGGYLIFGQSQSVGPGFEFEIPAA